MQKVGKNMTYNRADSGLAASQWETVLLNVALAGHKPTVSAVQHSDIYGNQISYLCTA